MPGNLFALFRFKGQGFERQGRGEVVRKLIGADDAQMPLNAGEAPSWDRSRGSAVRVVSRAGNAVGVERKTLDLPETGGTMRSGGKGASPGLLFLCGDCYWSISKHRNENIHSRTPPISTHRRSCLGRLCGGDSLPECSPEAQRQSKSILAPHNGRSFIKLAIVS